MEPDPENIRTVYPSECSRRYALGYEPLSNSGLVKYGGFGSSNGSGHYNPVRRAGSMNTYQPCTCDICKHYLNSVPESWFHNDFARFEDYTQSLEYCSSHQRGSFANIFSRNSSQLSDIYHHPEWVYGRSLQSGFERNKHAGYQLNVNGGRTLWNYENGVPKYSNYLPPTCGISLNQGQMFEGYSNPAYNMYQWYSKPSWDINGLSIHVNNRTANYSMPNALPMPKGQHSSLILSDRIIGGGSGVSDASYINEDHFRLLEDSVGASNFCLLNQNRLPDENGIRNSTENSSYISDPTTYEEEESSLQKHDSKNRASTSSGNSVKDHSSVIASRNTESGKQTCEAHQSKANKLSKNRTSPVKRRFILRTSARRLVWRIKAGSKPSARKTEQSPVHHIPWDDLVESIESVGHCCTLCEKDLTSVMTDDESEYRDEFAALLLPEVAILPCGHAFHSECLLEITPDELLSNPPCFFCFSSVI